MTKPLILVTNDDGITSKGIKVLIEEMSKIGEVYVMAPDSPNSGMGHAITVDTTIHIKKSPIFGDIASYECSGTPADCVKLAKHEFLKGRKKLIHFQFRQYIFSLLFFKTCLFYNKHKFD